MRIFHVKAYEDTGMDPHPDSIGSQVIGFRAPGPGVLVLEEGACWVTLPDGSRENLSAKSVVQWETNDWVEYGSCGPAPFRTRNYWAVAAPSEDSERRLGEIFGGSHPAGSA
jgi:hypothetical protein